MIKSLSIVLKALKINALAKLLDLFCLFTSLPQRKSRDKPEIHLRAEGERGERQVKAPRRTQAGHVTGIIAVGVTRTHQLHRFLHPGIHGQTSLNYISRGRNFLFTTLLFTSQRNEQRFLSDRSSDYRSKNSRRMEKRKTKGEEKTIVSVYIYSFVHARSLSLCFPSLLCFLRSLVSLLLFSSKRRIFEYRTRETISRKVSIN